LAFGVVGILVVLTLAKAPFDQLREDIIEYTIFVVQFVVRLIKNGI
jgi:hypothetical protein